MFNHILRFFKKSRKDAPVAPPPKAPPPKTEAPDEPEGGKYLDTFRGLAFMHRFNHKPAGSKSDLLRRRSVQGFFP